MSINRSPSTGTPIPPTISAPYTALFPPHREKQLLNAFFDAQSPLVQIAREFDISIADLAAWADQPRIRSTLLHVARVGQMRTHMLAADLGPRALHSLHALSSLPPTDAADNRAAGAMARLTDVSRKSAMDTLKIGFKDLDDLYDPKVSDSPTSDPAPNGASTLNVPTPSDLHHPSLPARPRTAVEELLSLSGAAPTTRDTSQLTVPRPTTPPARPPFATHQSPKPVPSETATSKAGIPPDTPRPP